MCQFEMADEWLANQGIEEGDEWPEDIDEDEISDKVQLQNEFMNIYLEALESL